MSRILLVEDEIHIAEGLMFNLRNVGYDVEMAETAGSALAAIAAARDRGEHFDLLLLDVMLPDRSGLELAQSLRRSGHTEPILILSARDRRGDVVAGLDAGADDYITKPFDLDEVLARIRGALRRQVWERAGQADDSPASPAGERAVSAADAGSSASADASGSAAAAASASANGALRYGAWRIDFARHAAQPIDDPDAGSLSDPDATVRLSPREIAILKLFAARPGEVISRATFLEEAWGLPGNLETRTVDNFIRRLRQHFEPDPASPRHILSVRGVGYRFEP